MRLTEKMGIYNYGSSDLTLHLFICRRLDRIFRILASAIILALLVVASPTISIQAQTGREYISTSPEEGEIGHRIYIEGWNFDYPNEDVDIYFCREEVDVGDDINDIDAYKQLKTDVYIVEVEEPGTLFATFIVPDVLDDGDKEKDVTGGTYFVFVTYSGENKIVAIDKFTVTGINIYPNKGPVGTIVKITGEGFGKRDEIEIKYDDDDIEIKSGDEKTDSKGTFTLYIKVPGGTQGDHTISVKVDGDKAEAEFTVQPQVIISPTKGRGGTEVKVTGTGFVKNEDVTVTFGDDEVKETKTNRDGSFEATFDVPAMKAGNYDVEAKDGYGNIAMAKFTMASSIDLSPTAGNVGTLLIVSGTGFVAGKTVTIKYDATDIATTTVANDGTFTATFNAPASQGGSHTITATDGTSTLTSTFTMESTPPPIPEPLLPELDTEVKAEAHFEWKDVDDPSGVTYTLQIATDENFTVDSIVLEKTGLTESEYTLTEEEKLEATEKEAPYYWRVRAIDGAGNESGWTGAGSFHVSSTTEKTGWVTYLLIGLGSISLLIVSFLLTWRIARK